VNCHNVDRWLDDGGPEAVRVAVLTHARSCSRCAAALAIADALEVALAAAPPAAPPGFTDRVMARVAAGSPVRARIPVMELLPLLQTFPWWVRLALEPASLLAALLASVLVVRGDALFALAAGGAVQLAEWLAQAAPPSVAASAPAGAPDPLVAILLQPTVLTCVVLGAAPLVLMGSRLLYGWSATLVGPRHLRLRAR
jgi:hypothetical protein